MLLNSVNGLNYSRISRRAIFSHPDIVIELLKFLYLRGIIFLQLLIIILHQSSSHLQIPCVVLLWYLVQNRDRLFSVAINVINNDFREMFIKQP